MDRMETLKENEKHKREDHQQTVKKMILSRSRSRISGNNGDEEAGGEGLGGDEKTLAVSKVE